MKKCDNVFCYFNYAESMCNHLDHEEMKCTALDRFRYKLKCLHVWGEATVHNKTIEYCIKCKVPKSIIEEEK